jgi:hypothetical protein
MEAGRARKSVLVSIYISLRSHHTTSAIVYKCLTVAVTIGGFYSTAKRNLAKIYWKALRACSESSGDIERIESNRIKTTKAITRIHHVIINIMKAYFRHRRHDAKAVAPVLAAASAFRLDYHFGVLRAFDIEI